MDPLKRITSEAAKNDLYFSEEPHRQDEYVSNAFLLKCLFIFILLWLNAGGHYRPLGSVYFGEW